MSASAPSTAPRAASSVPASGAGEVALAASESSAIVPSPPATVLPTHDVTTHTKPRRASRIKGDCACNPHTKTLRPQKTGFLPTEQAVAPTGDRGGQGDSWGQKVDSVDALTDRAPGVEFMD